MTGAHGCEADLVLAEFAGGRACGVARDLLKQSRNVWLRHNDENGEWMWAVEAAANREFWFNAFLTRADAEAWCAAASLTVVGAEDEWAKGLTWPQMEYDEHAQNPVRDRCLAGGKSR